MHALWLLLAPLPPGKSAEALFNSSRLFISCIVVADTAALQRCSPCAMLCSTDDPADPDWWSPSPAPALLFVRQSLAAAAVESLEAALPLAALLRAASLAAVAALIAMPTFPAEPGRTRDTSLTDAASRGDTYECLLPGLPSPDSLSHASVDSLPVPKDPVDGNCDFSSMPTCLRLCLTSSSAPSAIATTPNTARHTPMAACAAVDSPCCCCCQA
jgi:hypothetical protein